MLEFVITISDNHQNVSIMDKKTGVGYGKFTTNLTSEKMANFMVDFLNNIYPEVFLKVNKEEA